jgi:hypothetical protein
VVSGLHQREDEIRKTTDYHINEDSEDSIFYRTYILKHSNPLSGYLKNIRRLNFITPRRAIMSNPSQIENVFNKLSIELEDA